MSIPKTIEVTADDIAMGLQCDCNECPVARAGNRAFELGPGDGYCEFVDRTGSGDWRLSTYVGYHELNGEYRLPGAGEWASAFDTSKNIVKPATFDVIPV